MSTKQDKMEVVNADGSVLEVKLDDVTDPQIKKEVDAMKSGNNVHFNGKIVKIIKK